VESAPVKNTLNVVRYLVSFDKNLVAKFLTRIECLLLSDIEDIPENIKYCKNLQVADFSSNPLQR